MSHDTIITAQRAPSRLAESSWRHWNLAAVAAITAYATGVGWQAQLVSYPLFRQVSAADFKAYHQAYGEAIPLVVIAPGFLSFLACIGFFWTRPPEIPRSVAALVSLTGLTAIGTTVLWAIPRHDRLDKIGQDAATISSLIEANAYRTGALTLGTLALGWCVVRMRRG